MKLKKISSNLKLLSKLAIVVTAILVPLLNHLSLDLRSLINDNLVITAIDIGQGDSLFIRTPTNKTVLVDAGSGNLISQKIGELFEGRKCSIDLAVATHSDKDHIEGFIDLIDYCQIKSIFINKSLEKKGPWLKLKEKIAAHKIVNFAVSKGAEIILDEVILKILWPPNMSEETGKSNNSSISILVEYCGFKLLAMGDLPTQEEETLAKNINQNINVLKISHHGSKFSTSNSFLQLIRPEDSIISAGKNNSYNHPSNEVLEKLTAHNVSIFRTDISGNLTIKVEKLTKYSSKYIIYP